MLINTSNRFYYTLSTSIFISNTIFKLISFNNHGGAICLDNIDLTSEIFFCTFEKCSTTGLGGGTAILKSKKSLFKLNCFFYGIAQYCPGFVFYGNVFTSFNSELNFTSDYNPNLCGEGSAIISNKILTSNNNVSNSNTNVISSGFYFGSIISQNLATFTQISSSKGPGMIGLCMLTNSLSPSLTYINFINNSCDNYWIEFYTNNNNPNFYYCQFKDINIKPLISSTGLIQFFNCEFNFPYNNLYHLSINTNSNLFNISILINSFQFKNLFGQT